MQCNAIQMCFHPASVPERMRLRRVLQRHPRSKRAQITAGAELWLKQGVLTNTGLPFFKLTAER